MFFVEDEEWGGRNVIECKKNEQDVIEIDDFDYSELGKEAEALSQKIKKKQEQEHIFYVLEQGLQSTSGLSLLEQMAGYMNTFLATETVQRTCSTTITSIFTYRKQAATSAALFEP